MAVRPQWLCKCGHWISDESHVHHLGYETVELHGMNGFIHVAQGREKLETMHWSEATRFREYRDGRWLEFSGRAAEASPKFEIGITSAPIQKVSKVWADVWDVPDEKAKALHNGPPIPQWGHDENGKPLEVEKVVLTLFSSGGPVGQFRMKRFASYSRGDAIHFPTEPGYVCLYREDGNVDIGAMPLEIFNQINGKTFDWTIDPVEAMKERFMRGLRGDADK